MIQIAIYGKGGIGKSTISANISAAAANMNNKVLQIGCDPKHDSTKLLLGGSRIQTVLDYLRDKAPQDCVLSDIMYEGYGGIHCIEAGGPEPGVGCAGRGILTTFETIERLGIAYEHYNLVLYDVLGDVVCGGFAVPLRRDYAEKVYIVTSGEFMSIYAANNILRGVKNYSDSESRIGGIIYNSRAVEGELSRVKSFAEAVGLPILGNIPRSKLFAESEKSGVTLIQKYPESKLAHDFKSLACEILSNKHAHPANPLEDDALESLVLGLKHSRPVPKSPDTSEFKPKKEENIFSKNLLSREPFHGCAFNGAAFIAMQIKDAVVVSNGPTSCSHITYQAATSIGRRSLLERGLVLPIQVSPGFTTSKMDDNIVVFGGNQLLEDKIKQLKTHKPKLIVVATTCPSGIIGEHADEAESLSDNDTKVITLMTEGNITGDFMQGMIRAYFELADRLIDMSIDPDPLKYNIFGEKAIANTTQTNFTKLKSWLNKLGLTENCRYLLNTDMESVKNLRTGAINIRSDDTYMCDILEDHFRKKAGLEFFPHPMPVGFDDSVRWIETMSRQVGKPETGKSIIAEEARIYAEKISELSPQLSGKTLMVVSYNHNVDWILKTAIDLNMKIIKVGILNFSQDMNFRSNYKDKIDSLELNYTAQKKREDLDILKPDLLVANYSTDIASTDTKMDNIPLCPDIGFLSGIKLAERWRDLFKLDIKEGWRQDEHLFKKYYEQKI